MTRTVVAAFQQRLMEAIEGLERARSGAWRDLWRAAFEVEHLVLSDVVDAAEADEILRGLEGAGKVAPCQAAFAKLEPMIERGLAAQAVSGHRSLLEDRESLTANYLARYEELARREVALVEMTAGDRVLFLGSGPLPISAIEYCRQTGCEADCVDFVDDAIRVSREVIRAVGMEGRMRCHRARAEQFPVAGYSVVMIGVLAKPKAAIFENVASGRSEGCRVLARTTYGLRGLIYAPLEAEFTTPERLRNARASVARGDQVLSAIRGLEI
ncbi:MAG: nicotianamine synthase family protein [bacterium]